MSIQRFTLFTEAVKGGMDADTHGFHFHLVTTDHHYKDTHHLLTSLADLHKYHKLLTHPDTSATLHVGIGGKYAIDDAKSGVERGDSPEASDFTTHVRLHKPRGSNIFKPAWMTTMDSEQRKGWGTTLWNHLDRKLTKAGLGIVHDWKGQTGDGHAWSRKSSGQSNEITSQDDNTIAGRADPGSEWHKLSPEQKKTFRSVAAPHITRGEGEFLDPKVRRGVGLFGDTQVHAVRRELRTKHGINMHQYSVADTMHHMTGGYGAHGYTSGYHGTRLDRLRQKFNDERDRRPSPGERERPVRRSTLLAKQKEMVK
jgi:hypothetical protein